MSMTAVIQRLRAACPSFEQRVAGAAEFALAYAAAEEDSVPVPHAFVLSGDDVADVSLSAGRTDQPLEEGFTIALAVDNTSEDRGQGAMATTEDLKAEVWAALLGWQMSGEHGAMEYRSGARDAVNRARLFYLMEFAATRIIGESPS